jgi:hypothetical protein
MPREERFFGFYSAHAQMLIRGAKTLQAMLEGGE